MKFFTIIKLKTIITFSIVFLTHINLLSQTNLKQLEPEEYMDFWVGEWDLTWETQFNKGFGKNTIKKILNEKVIEENFYVTNDPNMKNFSGKSWSLYNKSSNTWKQTWVDNNGTYLDFIGDFKENKRIFYRKVSGSNNTVRIQRMVFLNIQPNSFTWEWETSDDNGETWELKWRIFYKRK